MPEFDTKECPSCGGVGEQFHNGKWEKCLRCNGSGEVSK